MCNWMKLFDTGTTYAVRDITRLYSQPDFDWKWSTRPAHCTTVSGKCGTHGCFCIELRHRLHTITSFADNYLNRKGSIVSMADIDTVVARQHQRIAYTTTKQIVIFVSQFIIILSVFRAILFHNRLWQSDSKWWSLSVFSFSNMKLLMRMLIASHEIQNMRVPYIHNCPIHQKAAWLLYYTLDKCRHGWVCGVCMLSVILTLKLRLINIKSVSCEWCVDIEFMIHTFIHVEVIDKFLRMMQSPWNSLSIHWTITAKDDSISN